MSLICLAVDRLNTGYLGSYGNTWVQTPHLDLLAAESVLFQEAYADSPHLPQLYRSYWHAQHPLMAESGNLQNTTHLAKSLRDRGVTTWLVTDDVLLADEQSLVEEWDEVVVIPTTPREANSVDLAETELAQFFAKVCEILPELPQTPFCLWIHARGMASGWDAVENREQFLEDEEEDILTFRNVPQIKLDDDFDPDQVLGYRRAYAGQVTLLDECFGAFREACEELELLEKTHLAVWGCRGFPLGTHQSISQTDPSLFGELIHVPLFVRCPQGTGASSRARQFVAPADLYFTILELFQISQEQTAPWGQSLLPVCRDDTLDRWRDRLVVVGDQNERGVRTPAWYLRIPPHATDDDLADLPKGLYVKPDDRWEVNNVSDRCPQIVEQIGEVRASWESLLREGSVEFPPLDDVLIEGLE